MDDALRETEPVRTDAVAESGVEVDELRWLSGSNGTNGAVNPGVAGI